MAFKIQVQEVNVSSAGNGPRKYQIANVIYSYNGENRTQKIMSFANPEVFKAIQDVKSGQTVEVDTVKNDKGFTNWSRVAVVADGSSAPAQAKAGAVGTPTKVVGSTYETAEERKVKQMLIVKQSSISNAIDYLKGNAPDAEFNVSTVLEIAQQFVDFVYGTNETLGSMDGEDQGISKE